MSFRRIHLHLAVHGSPTAPAVIDYGCALASAFGAKLRVTSPRLDVHPPRHWLAGATLASMAADVEKNAAAKAAELDSHLASAARAAGVTFDLLAFTEHWPRGESQTSPLGRVSDLSVLGLPRDDVERRLEIEDWLFGTGRPCLLVPNAEPPPFSLDVAVIAWDESKTAARAVGDALPLLHKAKTVRVLVVRGEKAIARDPAAPLIDYLRTHGIEAVADTAELGRSGVGATILDHAAGVKANLLVMGAFGHSRAREFVLGGATKDILDAAALPLLMSH
ncbi:MAG: universal stress protein [Hyphomonadaceae bacterium]|nr:universal stress protein [Hyphomonadaceae bacterium]